MYESIELKQEQAHILVGEYIVLQGASLREVGPENDGPMTRKKLSRSQYRFDCPCRIKGATRGTPGQRAGAAREKEEGKKVRREMVAVGDGDVGDIGALFSCLVTARSDLSPFSIIDLSSDLTGRALIAHTRPTKY